jgi:hypothetical protein
MGRMRAGLVCAEPAAAMLAQVPGERSWRLGQGGLSWSIALRPDRHHCLRCADVSTPQS